MSKLDEIQEKIREAYNKYYEDSEKLIDAAIKAGEIDEVEAADIVIY